MMKIISAFLTVLLLSAVLIGQANRSAHEAALIPIVDLKLNGLLGGVRKGKWITPAETVKFIAKNPEFSALDLKTSMSSAVFMGTIFEPEDPCDEFYRAEFENNLKSGIAIGVGASWNPQPRVPQKLENDSNIYNQAVKKFLARKGLTNSTVKITQVFRIDLDGDGVEEVVITATHYKKDGSPSAAAGDYSFVMVRKVFGKNVEEILIDGDFHKKGVEFGAPNIYEVSAIADLNGDGSMEIVVYGEYYEGAFSNVYELNGNSAKSVLGSGCGV